jgi:Ribosomal protein L5
MARLQDYYKNTVVPELKKQFGFQSVMQVPRISKITINMGVGEAVADKKVIEHAMDDLTRISGQKPVVTYSKKRYPISSYARAGQSAARLPCGVIVCTSFWIV